MSILRRGVARLFRFLPDFPARARIVRHLDSIIPGRERPTRATVQGVTYTLATVDHISRRLLYDGAYQPDVLDACDRIMAGRETGVLWDVGANIGTMSLPLLERHPGWTSVCFEPSPTVVASLRRNRDLNPDLASRMHICCAALMDETRLVEFYDSGEPHNLGVGRLAESHNTVARSIWTGGYRGDDLVDRVGVPRPDLLKVDVEGFELEVLRGLEPQLRGEDVPAIVFELSEYRYVERDVDADDVVEFVRSLGFEIRRLDPRGVEAAHADTDGMYGNFLATPRDAGGLWPEDGGAPGTEISAQSGRRPRHRREEGC